MEQSVNRTGISLQGYIPVRNEPRETAGMVTQVLFGEYVEVLKDNANWFYVRLLNDNYQGWVDRKCIEFTDKHECLPNIVVRNSVRIDNITTGYPVILPIGSSLPKPEHGIFLLAGNEFRIDDTRGYCNPSAVPLEDLVDELVSIPYLWGGRCGFGFDCSGLTQYLCRVAGKEIPRDAADQSATGQTINFLHESETGDLAFFGDEDGVIQHVGMLIGNNHIIHASGTVRIDRIDQHGIYNNRLSRYTHIIRVIKRVL